MAGWMALIFLAGFAAGIAAAFAFGAWLQREGDRPGRQYDDV